jgi:hypothetical protein
MLTFTPLDYLIIIGVVLVIFGLGLLLGVALGRHS